MGQIQNDDVRIHLSLELNFYLIFYYYNNQIRPNLICFDFEHEDYQIFYTLLFSQNAFASVANEYLSPVNGFALCQTSEVQRQENKLTSHLITLLQFDNHFGLKERVIDLGCGRGGTIFRISEKYSNLKIDGVNLTEYQTNFCKDEIIKRNLQNRIEVRQANFLSLPYADNTFTHAFCCEVTQYALDLEILFKEVYRVMDSGGRFVIATWCFNDNYNTSDYEKFMGSINFS